jgi:restriction endonuclease S subunit
MDISTQIKEKIASLQEQLLSQHPQMPTLLREIHATLKSYPEQVTLLSEEEICTIVSGLKKQTATEIATTALKSNKKSIKSMTLADL